MRILATIALSTIAFAAPARAEDQRPPQPCRPLAEFGAEILAHTHGHGQFVRLTHDQTVWARGYYAGSPPATSTDPGTEDAFFWSFEAGEGVVAFASKGIVCHTIFMSPADVRMLMDQGA